MTFKGPFQPIPSYNSVDSTIQTVKGNWALFWALTGPTPGFFEPTGSACGTVPGPDSNPWHNAIYSYTSSYSS